MAEGYSFEKYRQASEERLSPEKQERLRYFREAKERWRDAFRTKDSSMVSEAISAWKQVVEPFRPSVREYLSERGKKEYAALEAEQSKTKEGQLELAEEEAHFFNDAFDARKKRLEEAMQMKDQSPESAAEYEMAMNDFNELVENLNEGDLSKYGFAMENRKDIEDWFGPLGKRDLRPYEGPEAAWEPTSPVEEAPLLGLLERLPGGSEALNLYKQLQDPGLSKGAFFNSLSSYFNEQTYHHPEGAGAKPHVIIKELPGGRWLRLNFWDNGRIELRGRDDRNEE